MSLVEIVQQEGLTVCANWICRNLLGEYELKRLGKKFNKWRFCSTCRRNPRIQLIRCDQCGKPTENTGQRLYCKKCSQERTNERCKMAQRRRAAKVKRMKKIWEGEK